MNTRLFRTSLLNTGLLAATLAGSASSLANGPLPVSGMPVPELANFDQLMCDYMNDNDIEGGLLAVMKDGVIVYQRGFGWKDEGKTIPLRHDDLMRIASVTKPFTAAAIQNLYSTNALDPCDVVFDLGQQGGGILPYNAFPNLQDPRMGNINVQQILGHRSGLPTNDGADPMFQELQIQSDFDDAGIIVGNPPGRIRTTEWTLGGTLSQDPNLWTWNYSNFGFQVLGQVVESTSGQTHINYVKNNIMGPIDWMPLDEIVAGRTFPGDRDPREPWYNFTGTATNVFNPLGPAVRRPDGGYHHELHFASGAMVTSTTALLHLAENHYVNGNFTYGQPVNGARDDRTHNGLLWGTSAMLRQRSDGINIAILFNSGAPGFNPAVTFDGLLTTAIDNGGFAWPAQGVDGQWVDFNNGAAGIGSYEDAWSEAGNALGQAMDEATLNFKAGTSDWTGTINQRVRLRAPEGGTVRIGQQ